MVCVKFSKLNMMPMYPIWYKYDLLCLPIFLICTQVCVIHLSLVSPNVLYPAHHSLKGICFLYFLTWKSKGNIAKNVI